MELAIPIVALGSLLVIARNDKKSVKENYKNLNKMEIESGYPKESNVTPDNSVQFYPNANMSTDKYFKQEIFENKVKSNDNITSEELQKLNQISSLTGEKIDKDQFKHNNMVPFFGGRVTGAGPEYNIAESRLDNLQGLGSQHFSKRETAPLFQPERELSFANGTPDNTEFYLSRQNPSMNMANIKPWTSEQVGPGLNRGYTTKGSDGFNAGMEARKEWLPKTVDELRVETNPKLTFGLAGHQGPALAPITNVGLEGRVEKYRPDTYYQNNPNRWLTTTGLEKGERKRGTTILKEMKANCPSDHFGPANDGGATYIKGEFEETGRQQLNPDGWEPIIGPNRKEQIEPRDNINLTLNNRNTTANHELGPIHGIVQATIAPLLDAFRPTRKENVIGNLRKNGNVNGRANGGYITDPNNRTRITNRQMTEGRVNLNHVNVQGQGQEGYLISEQQPVNVQRDSTNHNKLLGVGGNSNQHGIRSVDAVENQRNNCNKVQNNTVLAGNMELFSGTQNLATIRDDCTRLNNRWWVPNGNPTIVRSAGNIGRTESMQTLSNHMNSERIQPDILTAFKQNPYTQSLTSAVAM